MKAGKKDKAIEIAKKLAVSKGEHSLEDAGPIFDTIGEKEQARQQFLRAANKYSEEARSNSSKRFSAARMWEAAEEYDKAAQIFADIHSYFDAANNWYRAGDNVKAQEAMERFEDLAAHDDSYARFMSREGAYYKELRQSRIMEAKRLRSKIRRVNKKIS